jgi:hypothetical protein
MPGKVVSSVVRGAVRLRRRVDARDAMADQLESAGCFSVTWSGTGSFAASATSVP